MERELERVLPVRLTLTELEERGKMLAEECDRYGQIEAEKKAAAAECKERLDDCRQEMTRLAAIVSCKHEQRPVRCQWEYDYAKGVKTLYRRDTGEVVKVETITAAELQLVMDAAQLRKDEEGDEGKQGNLLA